RSDSSGMIQGTIRCDPSSMIFSIKARICNHLVFGVIHSLTTNKAMIVYGTIQATMPSFTFSVQIPFIGRITGQGTYDGSFLPAPTGPYTVGIRSYHVVDETREEWFTDDPSDYRELMITVWYPSEYDGFDNRKPYMDAITFDWLRNKGPIPLISIPKDAYKFVNPYLYEDVPAVTTESFPILLFSPGYDGVDTIYTSFIDDLVSHGYIVVSMNHPYVSGITVFPDGRAVYLADRPGNFSESFEFLKQSQRTVIEDALFTLDFVEELHRTDPVLSGCFDVSRVGMFGHSFGGAATMSCCYEDERIQAGFTLDGVVYDEFLTGPIATPFLLMCAENRFNHSSYDHVWNQFFSDAYQIGIIGSTHYGFTDVGVLLSHMMPLIPASILGFGTVNPIHLIRITRLFELAFFDVFLKEYDKEMLTDLFNEFSDVMVKIK
ncbi:MAG: hypothetical protein QCI00_06690, partial [Candidatus Thermoplasmatota archaeon]|nr:hypothetical protein [Candidatus Thermoplasmatota archaeon]